MQFLIHFLLFLFHQLTYKITELLIKQIAEITNQHEIKLCHVSALNSNCHSQAIDMDSNVLKKVTSSTNEDIILDDPTTWCSFEQHLPVHHLQFKIQMKQLKTLYKKLITLKNLHVRTASSTALHLLAFTSNSKKIISKWPSNW